MIKKCIGCGITLQHIDENKLGYIKKDKINEAKYCKRCFRMMNYNDNQVVNLPHSEKQIIKEVNDKKYFVFFLVDLLNINKEVIETFKSITNDKCLIISKCDILPKSFKYEKITNWLEKTYKIKDKIIFNSSLKKISTSKIFDILDAYNTKKCFVMGYTNSGKSTLLNTITECSNKINVSPTPNTTLDFINIYYDEYLFIDTPGFILKNNIIDNNELDLIKKLNTKKFIKPGSYPLKKDTSIVIENKLRITNLDDINTFTFYIPNELSLNKVYPSNDSLKQYLLKTYHIKNNTDVVIKGLGFINIKKECDINIYTKNHDVIEFRKSFLGSEYYE